ncbi:MAG: CBS domain-containing protein [Deltaproteobacteria bacterium]|nr:CBS domain-containing protein [Deltaproteobacteria bacterium]
MGEQDVVETTDSGRMRQFTRAILDDLAALERMLRENRFESGIRRIGAEQEMFLVDVALRPSPTAGDVLKKLNDSSFTTELAKFNLEANAIPRVFGGSCLSEMEREIDGFVDKARRAANDCGSEILLSGILPTARLSDLGTDNMSPQPRYHALNRAMKKFRGGEFRVDIKGLDELHCSHDNVMLEACNTSFQIHFQVAADEFAKLYNIAQAITAPVLAAAVNSPILLEKRLWHETRVALFQQSVDARSSIHTERGERPRVHFGDSWVKEGVVELFREDISRFRSVLAIEREESPDVVLDRGDCPSLSALMLHNGTVYRWNRPCYGVKDGVAHLRVENRVLPSGPTVVDEVTNAAFFFGLMAYYAESDQDITRVFPFDDAKGNFFAAARHGLDAQFRWFDGRSTSADHLILDNLLPIAREGLAEGGIDSSDVDRYLGIIEERVLARKTGSQWALGSLAGMAGQGTKEARLRALVAQTIAAQKKKKPIHTWPQATLDEDLHDWRNSYRTVGQFMTREVFTVHPEDLVDLAASVMEWEHVRHIPVEDNEGKLVGLLTHRNLMRIISRGTRDGTKAVGVADIMNVKPLRVTPDTSTLDAISIMRSEKVSCLPVTNDEGELLGLVTESDFLDVAKVLLVKELKRVDLPLRTPPTPATPEE